jgi:hypothetical protein
MDDELLNLEKGLDELLFQLSKGITIDQLKKGKRWYGFEQVKEWKNRNGYKLYVYSNDHPIAHFHLVKEAEGVDCKFDFLGNLLGCTKTEVGRRIKDAILYFCELPQNQNKLIQMWNTKNPSYRID